MRPSPRLASASLLVLAAIHAWWGARMLLASSVLNGGTQIVGAGGLVLAAVAVAHGSRASLAVGLGAAAIATLARAIAILPGPFATATLVLAAAFGLAAYGARRLDLSADATGALALRGGALLAAACYVVFLALNAALGGLGPASFDFVARAAAASLFALAIDAPPLALRKAFARAPSSSGG